jgi:glycosyltransferase involved in cell wall biosynthesis
MHVLMVIASISRCAAGVGVSVRSLSQQLRNHGRVSVLSIRDEFTEVDQGAWQPPAPLVFGWHGPRWFGYSAALEKAMREVPCDLIHSHGLWMYPDLAARRTAQWADVPLLVSPHGMLDPWALRNSGWKKRLAGRLFTNKTLHTATCIHALCESEYHSIREYGLRNPVCVIPNGVDLPSDVARPEDSLGRIRMEDTRKTVLFIGRIHAKKGLENLVKAWAAVKSKEYPNNGWRLVVAGNDQLGHEGRLKSMVRDLALERDVVFPGPLRGSEKEAALAQADAFVLPSYSEGLPIAVLEAWAHGLPVVMTRQCNLPEGFTAGAALEVQPHPLSIAEGLERLFSMDQRELRAAGERGRTLVESRFTWPMLAGWMMDVYRWLLGEGPQPDCVRLS